MTIVINPKYVSAVLSRYSLLIMHDPLPRHDENVALDNPTDNQLEDFNQ